MLFKKGQSGNPNGRPKSQLNGLLSKHMAATYKDKTRDQWLVERLWNMAAMGNLDAIKFIWERLEGKIMPVQELANEDKVNMAKAIQDAIEDAKKANILPPIAPEHHSGTEYQA